MISCAQKSTKQWEKVIQLESEQKISSSLKKVDAIYEKALKEQNDAEIIKCFFYQSKYLQILDVNSKKTITNDIKVKMSLVSNDTKPILKLILAQCYQKYLLTANISYKTAVLDDLHEDFTVWNYNQFQAEIKRLYNETIEDKDFLSKIPLKKFESIFSFNNDLEFANTSVLDFLVAENICFLKENFYFNETTFLNETVFFSDSETFTNFNAATIQNLELKNLIQLFQILEKKPSHEKFLNRIAFFNEKIPTNKNLFENALLNLEILCKDDFLKQKIWIQKIKIFQISKNKDALLNILKIINDILKIENRSNAFKEAALLKEEIEKTSIYIETKSFIYPQEKHRALISYKNLDNVKISFYKIYHRDNLFLSKFDKIKNDSLIAIIRSKNQVFLASNYELPNSKDYNFHATEVILPYLPIGNYVMLFESFDKNSKLISRGNQTITSTNIGVLASSNNISNCFEVLNRATGTPLKNVFILKNDNKIDTLNNVENCVATKVKVYNEAQTFVFEQDTITFFDGYLPKQYEDDKKEIQFRKINIYTDRALYRPGQTVFFKGIAYQKNGMDKSTVENLLVHVTLQDRNDNIINDIDLKTNAFGSISGSFILPINGLNGQYEIIIGKPTVVSKCSLYDSKNEKHPFWTADFESENLSFKVEEYKRPRFEINFKPITQNIIIGQKVTIKGSAKAFSGSQVSQSAVKYTISGQRLPNGKNSIGYEILENTVGETITDENGNFEIIFDSKPSDNFKEKDLPITSYQISVSITDINGETHQNKKRLNAGYHNLKIVANVAEEIDVKNNVLASIQLTNLNSEPIYKECDVKIYYLDNFDAKFKPYSFNNNFDIDFFENSFDFSKEFPNEKERHTKQKDSTGKLVYSQRLTTKTQNKFPFLFLNSYQTGRYQFVITAVDDFGHTIENESFFNLTDISKPQTNILFKAQLIEDDYKKNGFATIKIHAIRPELYIIGKVFHKGKVVQTERILTKNGSGSFKILVEKSYESQLKVVFESLFENNKYFEESTIVLKDDTKSFVIETETFRNKIDPGSNEVWKFNIKSDTKIELTEVLASMYDASLDKFASLKWLKLNYDDNDDFDSSFRSFLGNRTKSASLFSKNNNRILFKSKNENIFLINFGFVFNQTKTFTIDSDYVNLIEKKRSKNRKDNLVNGFVYDKNSPISGATVSVVGTSRKVISDLDGYYEIEAFANEKLAFNFSGYKEKTIQIFTDKREDVVVEDNSNQLEEVVVSQGYKSVTRRSNTSSIKVIDDNSYTPMASVLQTLQGQVAGLNITTSSGSHGTSNNVIIRGSGSITGKEASLYVLDGKIIDVSTFQNINPSDIISVQILKSAEAIALYGANASNGAILIYSKSAMQQLSNIKTRRNLSETAFFFPDIKTNTKGDFELSFIAPEALTQWKLRLLAHNKKANSSYFQENIITQKELMLTPNFPRFFRENDSITITAKISNLTNLPKNGIATLEFTDVLSQQSIDVVMQNNNNSKSFNVKASENSTLSWTVVMPKDVIGIHYKIMAKSDAFSDGEENEIPVLSNSQLITESLPIWVDANSEKEFVMKNLYENNSKSLKNHQLIVDYTSNAKWLALQSLPYLMEYEHDCSEQLFAKFYANALSNSIIKSQPEIGKLLEKWRTTTNALTENNNLKNIDVNETPWANDLKSDDAQKLKLANLFDFNKTELAQKTLINQLLSRQQETGGFVWMGGENENLFITQYIVSGFGHLKLLAPKTLEDVKIQKMLENAIFFLDKNFEETNNNGTTLTEDLYYMYARSFFAKEFPLSKKGNQKINEVLKNITFKWKEFPLFGKTLASLILNRFDQTNTAKEIINVLKETAVTDKSFGMFWVENKTGYRWNESDVATQCLIIEAFAEITSDKKSIENLKKWLLKNKISSSWKTTKATTEATYAILLQGEPVELKPNQSVLKFSDKQYDILKKADDQNELNDGSVKVVLKSNEIDSEKSKLSVKNNSDNSIFGGFYWQYFENLNSVKSSENASLSVTKKIYHKNSTSKGFELAAISDVNPLKIGDLVTIRIEITCNQKTDFVHLKDMRASCFEPIDVLSNHEYKEGLYFYKSTKDAATHFFFDNIEKGKYILEYDVRVNNIGTFSNGIATIQSIYAPEFSSHTDQKIIIVK